MTKHNLSLEKLRLTIVSHGDYLAFLAFWEVNEDLDIVQALCAYQDYKIMPF
jgi:hypothetical protein